MPMGPTVRQAVTPIAASHTWGSDVRPPASCVGELVHHRVVLPSSTDCYELERLFVEQPELTSVVVICSDGAPLAVTRGPFFATFTGRLGFGRSLPRWRR